MAGHSTTLKQLVALCRQHVNSTPHPVEHGPTRAIAETQVTTLPHFDGVGQDLGNQVRQLIRAIFQSDFARPMAAEEVRGIKHQEPEITHRNASDIFRPFDSRVHPLLRNHHCHQLSISRSHAFCASSGASNQYSSSNGPISVSTTCRNHFRVSPGSKV